MLRFYLSTFFVGLFIYSGENHEKTDFFPICSGLKNNKREREGKESNLRQSREDEKQL